MKSSSALVAIAAGAFFCGCDSKPSATPSSDPCHPVPPTRCEKDVDCAPFLCRSGFCGTTCKSSATCAQGFVCGSGFCVKPATCGTCSGDYDCPTGKQCDLITSACK